MSRKAPAGFSLVEVVLAVGIIAFAFVALLGLLSVGLTTNKAANEDTLVASMGREVINTLHGRAFPPMAAGTTEDFLFDADGNAAAAGDAVYLCRVSTGTVSNAFQQQVVLAFYWPLPLSPDASARYQAPAIFARRR